MALDKTSDVMDRAYGIGTATEEPPVAHEDAPDRSKRLQSIEVAWLLWNQRRSLARWSLWGLALCTVSRRLCASCKHYASTAPTDASGLQFSF